MTDSSRRAVLRGSAFTAMAATLAVPSSSVLAAPRPPAAPPPDLRVVATRAALATLPDPAIGTIVFLAETGREGYFRCAAGSPPERDPLQGLFVASAAPGRHFARIWDGIAGLPEWFGAVPDAPEIDCADAIEACYALCPVSELAQADYRIRRTLRFARSHRTVRGVGRYATEPGRGTRIVFDRAAPHAATIDILVVGTAPPPVAQAEGIHLANLTLVREGRCTPHPSGEIARYPTGLRATFLFHCTFREITSLESSVGFYIGGVVYTKFDDCFSVRVQPGTSAARDYMVGYYLNGFIEFGYAGGNASLYMNRCLVADQHPQHVDPTGLLGRGSFVDTFLDGFESARIATGIAFDAAGKRGITQTIDLHIRSPILDGCTRFGIDIDLDATSSASVDIIDPYIYAHQTGGDRGILIRDGAGLTTISGGQVHGDFRGGNLWFSRTRGIRVVGTKLHQALRPLVVVEASGLFLEPQINNDSKSAPGFAIDCTALTRSIVRPVVIGSTPPSFVGGIALDAGCGHCEIDGSAIDPGCFRTPDATQKVQFAGADARTSRGFADRGNRLVGVAD